MEKSPDAFRTISEVAELLETPAHVLRFWESRFPQVRPVKRAGGRRYYRPSDVALLSGIKRLLHSEGLTIRGVQKVLREQGIRHVLTLADHSIVEGTLVHAADDQAAVTEAVLPQVSTREDTQPANRRSSVLILGQHAAQIDESSPVESEDAAVEAAVAVELTDDIVLAAIDDASLPEADAPPNVGAPPLIAEIAVKDQVGAASVDAAVAVMVSLPGPEEDSSEIEWLPKQLRALAHARPPHHREELRRFHDGLVALRARLAESASGRSR